MGCQGRAVSSNIAANSGEIALYASAHHASAPSNATERDRPGGPPSVGPLCGSILQASRRGTTRSVSLRVRLRACTTRVTREVEGASSEVVSRRVDLQRAYHCPQCGMTGRVLPVRGLSEQPRPSGWLSGALRTLPHMCGVRVRRYQDVSQVPIFGTWGECKSWTRENKV